MSISKNFVVRNGFEVSTDLILANADTNKVGVGTTAPQYTLHVNGGIGATDFYLTGIGTFANELNVGLGGTVLTVLGIGNSIGIGTALPQYLLDIRSPVSTGQTALYVQGDVRITGDLNLDDVTLDDATIQDLTVTNTLFTAGVSTFNSNVFINAALNVSGITTLGSYVDINNSVDISGALNIVGLSTLGGYVDINNSVDVGVDLNVVGLSTLGGYVDINNSVDISNNLNVVGVTTLATADINAGEIDVTRIGTGNLNVSGIATIATVDINAGEIDVTRIGTGNLNVTGIATIATISVVGAALSNLTVSGISTLAIVDINGGDIEVSNVDTTDLNVTGISTLGTVRVSSGIITATSGIVTYFGDGQYLNLSNSPYKGIGIGTTGGLVGYGITFLDLKGAGVSTTFYNSSVGIATIFFEGGGGGSGSIGIGSTFTGGAANGDLFYHIDYGRIFVYYDEVVLGIGTDAFWVDAAPFNVGIITALSNVSFSPGSAVAPSMFFIGDNQTGFFSPGTGQFTVVSSGSSVLNVNASGIRVTGVTTITNASGTVTIGIGTTALLVEGNARVTGILTVGSSSITLDGTTNTINVGTGLTLSSSGINVVGVITATSFSGNGSGLIGVSAGIGTTGSVNTSGIITATSFFGNGSGLTGVAATTLTIGAGTTAAPSISPTGDSNTGIFFPSADTIAFGEGGAEAMRVDSSGRLLVGTSSALGEFAFRASNSSDINLVVANGAAFSAATNQESRILLGKDEAGTLRPMGGISARPSDPTTSTGGILIFSTRGSGTLTERMRITSDGSLLHTGAGSIESTTGYSSVGCAFEANGSFLVTRASGAPTFFNRLTNDGTLIVFAQDTVTEGTISVSGTTVSYNGAHLSRWSQLPNGAERNNILRGSVLSNIDEMCEWIDAPKEAVLWQEGEELPEGVSVGDIKEPANPGGPQDNEQLNRMKVSEVEGDKNVSGVFQCWDDDDDTYINDFYCAMTGDFIIRIADGVTVQRGDLLMSAGDGTAKPQDDDIIRSKTVAKVTSTNVTCTYEDGSYCVPCVLMAC